MKLGEAGNEAYSSVFFSHSKIKEKWSLCARNAKQLVSPPDGTSIDYLAQGLVTMDILVTSAV